MKNLIAAAVIIVSLTTTLIGQAGGHTYRLDLTTSEGAQSPPDPVTIEGGVPGGPPRQLPLSIRLLARDRAEYRNGSDIVYEVEIRNVGNDPFAMPWSTDHAAFDGAVADRSEATIALEAHRGNDDTHTVVITRLSGGRSVPGSLQTLMPGDRAMIKARGTVFVWPDQIEKLAAAGALPVRARLRYQTPDVAWEPVVSTSTLPILLKLPTAQKR